MAYGYLCDTKKKVRRIRHYILDCMEERHITQLEIATKMGRTQSWFSKNLKEGSFSIVELLEIGKILRFDWKELLEKLND